MGTTVIICRSCGKTMQKQSGLFVKNETIREQCQDCQTAIATMRRIIIKKVFGWKND